ncbi:MAG: lysophospholipid acyltransferase family protein, partial [Proteocatella sp.]
MYRFFRETARFIATLIFRIKYEGLENIPEDGAFVIVGNHKHNFDPVLISFTTDRVINYLAKSELFKTKITKYIFESINCIRVDREKSDITAIKNCLKVLK